MDEAYFSGGALNAPVQQTPGNGFYDVSTRNIDITEDEQSVFGELTYAVTDKLKITAGVRVTNYSQSFYQIYGGAVAGAPTGLLNGVPVGFTGTSSNGAGTIETNPTATTAFPTNYAACPKNPLQASGANAAAYAVAGCPYQYSVIQLKENPVTPKVGISYQLNGGTLLYATYAEGERPGGTNPPVPATFCASDLAALGIVTSPTVFQHDTVKSTEVGGKFRLFNGQAQVNASAFHIDWVGVQFVVPLPICAFSYIANAGTAASDGAEFQATGRLGPFTVNGNIAYDNARYTAAVKGPLPAAGSGRVQSILANKGDNLGIPDWTGNFGIQYDTHVMEFPAYARMDYSYQGKYQRSTSLGTASFNVSVNPNFVNGDAVQQVNARVGVYYKSLEIAFYGKNLADSRTWINKNQGLGNYYFTGNTQQPRVIGMQMNYRF